MKPCDWERVSQRLKWCFRDFKNGTWGEEPEEGEGVVCIRAADFDRATGLLTDGPRTIRFVDEKTMGKVALSRGDLIVEKSGGGEKQLVGRAVLYDRDEPAVCSNFLARGRVAEDQSPRFLNYLWLSLYTSRQTYPHIKQTTGIQNLDLASMLNTRVQVVPRRHQERIADFLDEKTATIDGLVEKKRELLDRLAEKRQALITRAVTKGLDPDAPGGDRRADGMNPRDWETWKLSHAYSRIGSGTTPTSGDARYYTDSGGTPWVTTAELRENYISTTQQQITEAALEGFPTLRIYRPGSVMVAMYGATIGRLGMIEVAATCNQACCVFEESDQFDNRFLFYWLWHRRVDLIALSFGGGQPNISQQDLREERALCPPLHAQRRIARFLDETTAKIDAAAKQIRRSIDYLSEYRAALITAAVTGQMAEAI